ncbi:DUF4387 domain-containing protein [Novosphingopyxis sp.]|uniref:DUF4387 domain-containing protein n=1 Tax=Novosphingopyxis sp. TaxID=2709690 RepID=UPI003B5C67B8
MALVRDVCTHLRSKNAGPFWVTIDFFFDGVENFEKYASSPKLNRALFAQLFETDAEMVKCFPIKRLSTLKVSYPRATPQGGIVERDLHSGQQFVRLLDIDLGE